MAETGGVLSDRIKNWKKFMVLQLNKITSVTSRAHGTSKRNQETVVFRGIFDFFLNFSINEILTLQC